MIILAFLIGADIGWHIWEYKERRRLNENWDDLFNTKLESDNRWHDLCCHYLETIGELRAEIEKLKEQQPDTGAQSITKFYNTLCQKKSSTWKIGGEIYAWNDDKTKLIRTELVKIDTEKRLFITKDGKFKNAERI